MRVILTGGSGDLGQTLVPRLIGRDDTAVILDVRAPALDQGGLFVAGSILDRPLLAEAFAGADCVIHIAAWHGIHEARGEKAEYDFFDLNVRGTFEVFAAAAAAGIGKMIHISTTSVDNPGTLYGRSKILAERIAEDHARYNGMNVVTLRPRAFIPFWNRSVYAKYSDWARWFWRGAVHIDDVAAAVMLGLELIEREPPEPRPPLTLDGAYEYTDDDLANWDANGPGSTFRKYHAEYYDLAVSYGLDPALKPRKLNISDTIRYLGFQPSFSLGRLLTELAIYGDEGPPRPGEAR